MPPIPSWLRALLRCPADGAELAEREQLLVCPNGHEFGVVDGVPVMLTESDDETLWVRSASLAAAREVRHGSRASSDLFVDTIGCTPDVRARLAAHLEPIRRPLSEVDPVASSLVLATNGLLYKGLVGRLTRAPIPTISFPKATAGFFSMWAVAGAAGRLPVRGEVTAPSASILRWAPCWPPSGWRRMGTPGRIRGRRRHCLPFPKRAFHVAFSYSVFQHFGRKPGPIPAGDSAGAERGRAYARADGQCAGHPEPLPSGSTPLRQGQGFDVRYRTPRQLLATFNRIFGDVSLAADCFLGLGSRAATGIYCLWANRLIVDVSEALKSFPCAFPHPLLRRQCVCIDASR